MPIEQNELLIDLVQEWREMKREIASQEERGETVSPGEWEDVAEIEEQIAQCVSSLLPEKL
jgi:hypothetical protein